MLHETETVRADHRSVEQSHSLPDCHPFANRNLAMTSEIVTNRHVRINRYMRMDYRIPPDHRTRADYAVGANRPAFTKRNIGRDPRRWIDSSWWPIGRKEQRQHPCEIERRIRADDRRTARLTHQFRRHDRARRCTRA